MIKDAKPYTILVIEDNLGDFTIVEDFLLKQIVTPTIYRASCFSETERIIADTTTNLDVVLLDLSLPDKSGEDLVTSITKLITSCPIIILTDFTDIDFSIKSISLGIADYLLKDDLTAIILYKSIIYTLQRKKIVFELKESEKRYSSLFHTSPQPMWVYNLKTLLFVQVNNAAMQHYGYSEDEFFNMTILDLKPEEEREKALEIVNNLKRPQTTIIKDIFKHQKKSGKIIDVEIFSSLLIINNREFVSVIINDITEKNLYELKITKAIIQTQENERYEVGTEIHDNVCQILASSKIKFKMLEKVLPEAEMPKLIAGIEYMDLAFKELRNLSHRLAPSFLSDTSVADACKTLFNSLNIDHECTLVLHIDDEFKALKTSKDFQLNLYRILQEQFRNIVKYSQASIIEIEGFISNKNIYVAITDNGVGFNIADIKSGIGMANMKRRTELFSGQFKIDSSLGNGCKVFIEVPLLGVVVE